MSVNKSSGSSISRSVRRRQLAAVLIGLAALVGLLFAGSLAVLLYGRWARAPFSTSSRPVRVTVPAGATAASVARDLEAKHLIRSTRALTAAAKNGSVVPGVYDIAPNESAARIAARLSRGDVVTVRVTFPEGFTVKQMARRLERNHLADEATFLPLVTTQGSTVSPHAPANLEGYLFPDTYRFPLGATPQQIAARMCGTFDVVFAKKYATEIAASGRSLSDIVTVASMVEREAETDADRPVIASVIYNRLRRGMRLQIDATVEYALPEHKARLLYADLKTDSPYNTYRVAGLPPTPICCPGKPSLLAALHPAASDYLYYVARKGGAHIFARTEAEHNKNVRAYRAGR